MNIKLVTIVCIILSISSCSNHTYKLWRKHEYTETITHLLTTEDRKNIIFVGTTYDYIFKNQDLVIKLAEWEYNELLEFKIKNNFSINKNNIIKGSYTAICKCNNATIEQIDWLKTKGFNKKFNDGVYYKTDSIIGTRYLSYDIPLNKYEKIKDEIKIVVESQYSNDKLLEKITVTPLAVVVDTWEVAVWGSILVVASPFIAIQYYGAEDKN